jgi:hypothetical protein
MRRRKCPTPWRRDQARAVLLKDRLELGNLFELRVGLVVCVREKVRFHHPFCWVVILKGANSAAKTPRIQRRTVPLLRLDGVRVTLGARHAVRGAEEVLRRDAHGRVPASASVRPSNRAVGQGEAVAERHAQSGPCCRGP